MVSFQELPPELKTYWPVLAVRNLL